MKSNKYDIQDTEIRVLGDSSPAPKRKWGWIILIAALAIGVVASIIAFSYARSQEEEGIFEKSARQVIPHPLRGWMQSLDSITDICVITKDTTINDIPMRLYVPLNMTPRLEVGYKCDCSRERMEKKVKSLGKKELLNMLDEQVAEGKPRELTAVCRFCNTNYTFTERDLLS